MSTIGLVTILVKLFTLFISFTIGVILIWTYLARREPFYLFSLIIASIGFFFFLFNSFQTYYGSFLYNFKMAFLMDYFRELSLNFYLIFFLPYLAYLTPPKERFHQTHRILTVIFILMGVLLLVAAGLSPENFKSLHQPNPDLMPYRELWGISKGGYLLMTRDIFSALLAAYSLTYLSIHRKNPKKLEHTGAGSSWVLVSMIIFSSMSLISMLQDNGYFLRWIPGHLPFFPVGVLALNVAVLIPIMTRMIIRSNLSEQLLSEYNNQKAELHFQTTHDMSGLMNFQALTEAIDGLYEHDGFRDPVLLFHMRWRNYQFFAQSRGNSFIDRSIEVFSDGVFSSFRGTPFLYRLDSDEFVLWVDSRASDSGDDLSQSRIISDLERFFMNDMNVDDVVISLRMQITSIDISSNSPDSARAIANLAVLRDYGRRDGERALMLDRESLNRAHASLHRVSSLHNFLRSRSVSLVYQPVCKSNNDVHSFEVKFRAMELDRLFNMKELAENARDAGVLHKLNSLLMEQLVLDLKYLMARQMRPQLFISLGIVQTTDPSFFTQHIPYLLASGYSPQRISFHISETEDNLMTKERLYAMNQLRNFGLRLSLGDFGLGSCSLRSLLRLPVSTVSIDTPSFIGNESPYSAEALKQILQLSLNSGIVAIASGLEDLKDVAATEEMGASLFQGSVCMPPLTLEKIPGIWHS